MDSIKLRALALSFFTVGYNLVEGSIAMLGAVWSGSTALWGFGLDSMVESLSGLVMIWRFWNYDPGADEAAFERIEQQASRLVAWSLLFLGVYVAYESIRALVLREAPEPSWLGVGLAIASLVVMPILFWMKFRLGKSIGSPSLVADSKETLACMLLSAALLIGLVAYHIFRWWWIDSVTALVIAAMIIREGHKSLLEAR